MSKGKKTILVVDADAPHRESMRRILRTAGYRVLEAADFRDAENVHQQHRGQIDLLLTAISLPGGNGYDLAKGLREAEPDLEVLFVSGPTGATVGRYHDVPLTELQTLGRPFESGDLLQRVKALIADRSDPPKANHFAQET